MMAVTGYTSGAHGDEGTPEKSKIVEGKFAPKLSVKARYKLADGKPFEKESLNIDHFWTPPVSGDTKPNYNIVGDNRIKKVFKIPIGKLNEKKAKKRLNELREANKFPPDLNKDYYLPTNNNTKMPEQPDLQKIHDALYPNTGLSSRSAAHYMHVIPNSHFWTDLVQIRYS